ncbi:MAG: hypothetical protein V1789_07730, partial [PVC group bacterium]
RGHCEERSNEAILTNWDIAYSDHAFRSLRPSGARDDILGVVGQPLKAAATTFIVPMMIGMCLRLKIPKQQNSAFIAIGKEQ